MPAARLRAGFPLPRLYRAKPSHSAGIAPNQPGNSGSVRLEAAYNALAELSVKFNCQR